MGRLAMLGITGALRTTPTSALEALLFLQPPHLIIKEGARTAAARLWLQGSWRGAKGGHAAVLAGDRDLQGLLSRGGDASEPQGNLNRAFKVNLRDGDTRTGFDTEWEIPRGLVLYTDGSRMGDRAGAGVWSDGPATSRAIGLDPYATVLQTELAALRACARVILERRDRGKRIYICSDSRRALRALLKHLSCSRLANECIELMNEIAEHNRLEVVWVPGHAGIIGNEKADELAKQGSRLYAAPTGGDRVGVHIDYIKKLFQKRAEEGIAERWHSEKGARHAKTLFRTPTKKLAETLVDLGRDKLRSLVGLITGHWPLASYLARIGKEIDPLCPRCGMVEEDPHHLFTKCSGLDDIRWDVYGATCIRRISVDRDGIKGLYEFARRARMLTPTD